MNWMSFFIGFVCGLVLGGLVTHLAHEYLDAMLPLEDEKERWFGRKCPPCDGECKQGRDCPAGK